MIKSNIGGINYLVLSVGHACTLKCKNCGNLCPFTRPEMKKYELKDIKRDIKNILECVNFIGELQIQGGEPFIYSNLKDLIEFLALQEKIKHITIATNGTTIPKNDLFYLIKENNIAIRISNYQITKEKGITLDKKCKELGIESKLYNFAFENSEWAYLGGINTPCEYDDSVVSKRFWHCSFKNCLTLDNGELNWCSRMTNAYSLQGFQRRNGDYVDVRNSKNLKEEFWSFIKNKEFPEACRYCFGTYNAKHVTAREQINKK